MDKVRYCPQCRVPPWCSGWRDGIWAGGMRVACATSSAFRHSANSPSAGTGWASANPWTWSQPRSRSIARAVEVLHALGGHEQAEIVGKIDGAADQDGVAGVVARSWMNVRSIFSSSAVKRLSWLSELNPVPKSSIETWTPSPWSAQHGQRPVGIGRHAALGDLQP